MFTLPEVREANAVLSRLLDALGTTLTSQVGRQGARTRSLIGWLRAYGEQEMRAARLGARLYACFESAQAAGASVSGMDTVRQAMLAEAPVGLCALTIVNLGIRLSLVERCRTLAVTSFRSRSDVDLAQVTLNEAFESAEDYAADGDDDPGVWQALIALHAASSADLTGRARPLPKMASYTTGKILPSLVLSYRLYGDASRADELRAENKVVHPAFMPVSGQALTS